MELAGDDGKPGGPEESGARPQAGRGPEGRGETLHVPPGAVGRLDRAPRLPRPDEPAPSMSEPAQIPEEDRTGEVLSGRYRLLERATRGGSGYVYRAQHVGIGKQVAVKVLHQHFIGSPDQRERLLALALVLALI